MNAPRGNVHSGWSGLGRQNASQLTAGLMCRQPEFVLEGKKGKGRHIYSSAFIEKG